MIFRDKKRGGKNRIEILKMSHSFWGSFSKYILTFSEVDHDQGGLAPPSVPDIKQPSPPSSDKPPTSARSGKGSISDRRMSASKRSGKI